MDTGQTIVIVDDAAPPRFVPSTRLTLGLLVCFAFILQYSQRVNLPIAIVCMVNRTNRADQKLPISEAKVAKTNSTVNPNSSIMHSSTTMQPVTQAQKGGFLNEKQFHWIELQQQILLGGYWAGYIFTQIPGKCFHTFADD